MSNERDVIIWKLNKDLVRARLALSKIYNIASKVYCPEAKHASSFISRDEVDTIIKTIQEFFDEDAAKPTKKEAEYVCVKSLV